MLVLQCVAVATIPQRVYVVGAAYRGEITAYEDGETRDIVIQVTNTGNEDLVNVVLTDETQSGADIENLVWTLPNGETIEATTNDDGVLTATWDGPWAPEEVITGVATLTLPLGDDLHTNVASVTADGAISGEPVEDDDPYNGTPPPAVPAIDVTKNDEGDDVHEVQAGEHDVTVTITNDGNEALENFEFTDTTEEGQDVVWNEEDLAALEELTLEPGESFTVNGTVQVAAGETHRDNAVVTADGVISGEPVEDEDPTTYEGDPTYAIGDYVWIDENRDGIQDDEESPLDGVTVVLYDGEGEEIDRTTTDENGRYIFDNLPAGDYSVQFVLTDEQAEQYEFTSHTAGDDEEVDSDAGEEGRSATITLGPDNEFLTSDEDYEYVSVRASEGIDPTWDAGVVEIPVPEIQVDKNEPGDDVHHVAAGDHEVTVTFTNNGNEALEDFEFTDTTEEGQDVVWNEEDLAGLEDLTLQPGNSYTVNGTVQVAAGETHRDEVVVNATGVISGDPVEDDDPTTYEVPTVEIIKGDGDAQEGTIENDANTEDDAVAYEDGETRDIVIQVTNTGNEDLVDVVLTDETVSGAAIESLVWTTPDGTEIAAEDVDGVLTATWDGPWAPEEVITGVATLTLPADNQLHTNIATVTAEGAISGAPVEDDDPYNGTPPPAVPAIDVIKNDEGDDVHEVQAGVHDVTVTITNDGNEALENFEFEDTTQEGQDVVWNEDDLAGLENLVLEIGDSYTVNGTVQVAAGETHRDEVVVNATGAISGDPVEDDDPTTYIAEEEPVVPTDPADPAAPGDEPTDPADPAGPGTETPGDRDGVLSSTGANLALIFGALGLLLLVTGGALYARHRQGSEA